MDTPERIKQVLVIRRGDINMRTGKIAAQAAHASMAALLNQPGADIRTDLTGARHAVIPLDEEAHAWLMGSFVKVCLYVKTEAELLAIHQKAVEAGLRCSLIKDNGLTEFNGQPTHTAVAIGPNKASMIDEITGKLPLL